MGVHRGDTISVHYRGKLGNGETFDDSFSREPILFTVGQGQVVEAIDSGVEGLEPGEQRVIEVTPENGFGNRNDELIRNVPRTMLDDQEVGPGDAVEIQTEDGQVLIAQVQSINEDSITFDLNHPLAGQHLEFEIELVNIEQRAA